jgi:hypothetical protein
MFFEFYEQSGNVSSMLNNRTFVDRLSNAIARPAAVIMSAECRPGNS